MIKTYFPDKFIFLKVFSGIFFIFAIYLKSTSACSIVEIPSLRKEFKNAKDVFIGKVIATGKENSSEVIFGVEKSWKDNKKSEVIVKAFNYCSCPNRSFQFTTGKRFLIMTTKTGDSDFVAFEPCQFHVYDLAKNPIESNEDIKKLNSFWFRTWAKIYPF